MGYLVSNFKVHLVFQGVQYNYVPGLKIYIELSATFNAGLSEPGVPRHPQTLTVNPNSTSRSRLCPPHYCTDKRTDVWSRDFII